MVALQIRHVPDALRDALSAEAAARGQSLQTYLLDVLGREAATAANRRLATTWTIEAAPDHLTVDVGEMLHRQRTDREDHLVDTSSRRDRR